VKPLLALALLLTACVTTTADSPAADREAKRFVAPAGKSRIYIVRPGTRGGAVLSQAIVDGRIIGSLAIRTYLVVDVEPGEHKVVLGGDGQNSVTLPLRSEPDAVYFFSEPNFGGFRQVDSDEGKRAVSGAVRAAAAM